MFVSIVAATSRAPAPSYSNAGGTGDRTASITVTTSGWTGTVNASNAVDGGFVPNSTDAINPTSVTNGAEMRFDFGAGAKKYISEAKVYWNNNDATFLTHWEGSNNGSSWDSLSSDVGYTSNTMTFALTHANTNGYRYYRWFKTTGTVPAGFFLETEFKIDDGS
jgi:hypothetical protein